MAAPDVLVIQIEEPEGAPPRPLPFWSFHGPWLITGFCMLALLGVTLVFTLDCLQTDTHCHEVAVTGLVSSIVAYVMAVVVPFYIRLRQH